MSIFTLSIETAEGKSFQHPYHLGTIERVARDVMAYRVTYPLITTDGHRDFGTREEAEAFARQKRNNPGRFQTANSWQLVKVEEVGA